MTVLLYILSTVVFIQAVAIIYLISREIKNGKKIKQIISNHSKIAEILTLHSKKIGIGKKKDDSNIYFN
jgi:hypothetical protein